MRRFLLFTAILGTATVIGCAPAGKPKPQQPLAAKLTPRSKQPPAAPPVRQVTISPEQVTAATVELRAGLKSSDGLIRAHTIEAMRQSTPTVFEKEIVAALEDPAPIARTAAALAVGELKLSAAYPALLKLAADEDNFVQIAVRFALHRLGDTRLSRDLELFVQSDNARIRGMTAMVLGMLEEPSAVKLLRPMQGDRDAIVRLQVAEALWRLGQERGLANLAAAAVSAYPDDQMVAFIALAQPRDRRIIEHVRGGLTADYEEVRLVAARAMGMLGSDEGYTIATTGLKSVDPRKRTLGALALGAISRPDAIDALSPLLKDNNTDVRVATAGAILQLAD
ncbi:MAG TPA: HEAT repeat domain-containing protein [Tepidisphaeraceae bacterium]|jgi:HEAT repeat protein|nr:HEAT repeat domain-containing protein [Tepidisphaeraceae bacterium]